jgi:hypothetical protein
MKARILWNAALIICISLAACNPSRNIIASGKVTPKGSFKAGGNLNFNIATAPIAEIDDITISAIDAINNHSDSIFYNQTVKTLTRGLLAYSLDPINSNYDFYLRYGLVKRLDVGYKFASGAHVFDVMYQFMGSTGTPDDPEASTGMHGSIGIQYSGQKSNLPSKLGLDRLSVFSVPFGPEEQYGNFSFGLAYGHSFITYGFDPSKKLVRAVGDHFEGITAFKNNVDYSSFGAFINAKLGFKYAYLLPAVSFYYQNYGTYDLFGFQEESYKGVTIIPSLGIQFAIGRKATTQTKEEY